MDELRWHQPVFAGDTLHVTAELVDKETAENPKFGHTRAEIVTKNQDGEVVLSMYGLGLVRKR